MSLHSLPIFVRLRGRAVILVGEGEAADAKRRLRERAGAVVVPEPLFAPSEVEGSTGAGPSTSLGTNGPGPPLAIVVDDDAAVARLKARGVLVNAVDRPELCDFTLPAIVDRSPVIVAVGTGGASAGLAAALRQRLEAILPAGLGRLAEALFAGRAAWRERYPEAGERRRAIAAALGEGGELDPFSVRPELVEGLPSSSPHGGGEGQHFDKLNANGSGAGRTEVMLLRSPDPDDLTLRQARLLANADRVTHGADVPAAILDRARADAARIETRVPPVDPAPGLNVDVRMQR